MAKHLQNEIENLKKKLLMLSSVVETTVDKAVKSVGELDGKSAKEVMDSDYIIDTEEVQVEEECLKILALHQPVAVDLRFVIATLKINNDLERIGDLAVNIAEKALYLSKKSIIKAPFDFTNMAEKSSLMLKKSLDSFIRFDAELASQVCLDDEEVDALNREMYGKVYERIKEKPEDVKILINYLNVSRHLERIADYATNIAEDVIYMIEGRIVRHKPEELE